MCFDLGGGFIQTLYILCYEMIASCCRVML